MEVINTPDLITSRLPALRAYQHSIDAPTPPAGSFDQAAAGRGKAILLTRATCAGCPALPLLGDNTLHRGAEIGIDDLKPCGLQPVCIVLRLQVDCFQRAKGGFYHDGRYAALSEVVNHYNDYIKLNLTPAEKHDLEEF